MTYRVTWELDLDATSPEKAARKAQAWMDEGDTGWVFDIQKVDKDGKPVGEIHQIDMGELLDEEWMKENGPQE